jgi:hypothetical protein
VFLDDGVAADEPLLAVPINLSVPTNGRKAKIRRLPSPPRLSLSAPLLVFLGRIGGSPSLSLAFFVFSLFSLSLSLFRFLSLSLYLAARPRACQVLLRLPQDQAFVGFTASTGLKWQKHDVLSWAWCGQLPCPQSHQAEFESSVNTTLLHLFVSLPCATQFGRAPESYHREHQPGQGRFIRVALMVHFKQVKSKPALCQFGTSTLPLMLPPYCVLPEL